MHLAVTIIYLVIFNPFTMWFIHKLCAPLWPEQYVQAGVNVNLIVEYVIVSFIFFFIMRLLFQELRYYSESETIDGISKSSKPIRGTLFLAIITTVIAGLISIYVDLAVILKNTLRSAMMDLGYIRTYLTFSWIYLLLAALLDLRGAKPIKDSKEIKEEE